MCAGKVESILNRLDDCADQQSTVSVAGAMDEIGNRSFGPLILLPALLVITPIGGVPGVPTLFAIAILIFAIQVALGRDSLWLPDAIRNRSVENDSIHKATQKARPVASWLDDHTSERLTALTRRPAPRVAAVMVVLLCLTVPSTEILPFASLMPMSAIALLGLAITVRDGLLMALGLIAGAAGLIGGVWLLISY